MTKSIIETIEYEETEEQNNITHIKISVTFLRVWTLVFLIIGFILGTMFF